MKKLSAILIQLIMIILLIEGNSFSQTPIRGYIKWNRPYVEFDTTTPPESLLNVNFTKNKILDESAIRSYINKLKDSLKKNIDIVNPKLAYNEAKILENLNKSIKDSVNKIIDDEIKNPNIGGSIAHTSRIKNLNLLAENIDSLRLAFSAIHKIYGNQKIKSRFFVRNRQQAILAYGMYDDRLLNIGNNFSIFGWGDKGTINAEVISFLMGPLRFTFNTLVSTTKDTTKLENAKLRTWTGNGGNLIFGIHTPFFHAKTKGTATFIETNIKYATESPIVGSPFKTDTLFYNFNMGLDFHFAAKIPIFGGSSFYIDSRPSVVIGSKSYLDALQTKSNFFLLQSIVGIEIPNIGRIGLTLPVISSVNSLTNNTFLLTIQAFPQSINK